MNESYSNFEAEQKFGKFKSDLLEIVSYANYYLHHQYEDLREGLVRVLGEELAKTAVVTSEIIHPEVLEKFIISIDNTPLYCVDFEPDNGSVEDVELLDESKLEDLFSRGHLK